MYFLVTCIYVGLFTGEAEEGRRFSTMADYPVYCNEVDRESFHFDNSDVLYFIFGPELISTAKS